MTTTKHKITELHNSMREQMTELYELFYNDDGEFMPFDYKLKKKLSLRHKIWNKSRDILHLLKPIIKELEKKAT